MLWAMSYQTALRADFLDVEKLPNPRVGCKRFRKCSGVVNQWPHRSEAQVREACNALLVVARHVAVRCVVDLPTPIQSSLAHILPRVVPCMPFRLTATPNLRPARTSAARFRMSRLKRADLPTLGRPTIATYREKHINRFCAERTTASALNQPKFGNAPPVAARLPEQRMLAH